MGATRKSLHFDLDSAKLIEACSNSENNIRTNTYAYRQISHFLEDHGFEHRQGSGYTTKEGMSRVAVERVVGEMVDEFPWFADCVQKIDVTYVGKTFDLKPTVLGEEPSKEKPIEDEKITTRKAINFDLDYLALKDVYTRKDGSPKKPEGAYVALRQFLEKNGLMHRQGSGYLSDGKMPYSQILKITTEMTDRYPWLAKCVRSIDVTSVKKTFDLMPAVQERSQNRAYEKTVDVNTKGDAVLIGGCHEVVLDDIPKEEWPYIADVKDGSIIIDDKAMERDLQMPDNEEPEPDAQNLDIGAPNIEDRDAEDRNDRLGDEYGD